MGIGHDELDTRRAALGVAVNGDQAAIRAWVKSNLISSGKFQAIIPLLHPSQAEGWNAYIIAVLNAVDAFAEGVEKLVSQMEIEEKVVWVDHLEQQINLDMYYPLDGGAEAEHALSQSIEFVQCEPEARDEYCELQSTFTGPAMRRLHSLNRAGRFIGFECSQRLLGADNPLFDVIHLSGFLPGQKDGGEQDFWQAFDAAARAIGRDSGRSVMQSWNEQRTRRFLLVDQIDAVSVSTSALES